MNKTFCSNCGSEIENGAKFCTNCGTAVANTTNNNQLNQTIETNTQNQSNVQPMTRTEIKAKAKEFSRTNKWNVWRATLIVAAITFVLGEITNKIDKSIVSSAVTIGLIPLGFGFSLYMLNLVRNRKFDISQLFSFYKNNLWTSLKTGILRGLVIAVSVIPFYLLSVLGISFGMAAVVEFFANDYSFLDPIKLLWFLPLLLVACIPIAYFTIKYVMTSYVIADDYDGGAVECLRKSKNLMRGYKWDYTIFVLSFIGWYFLITLTFGIAAIWFVPYFSTAQTLYYENLKKIKNV